MTISFIFLIDFKDFDSPPPKYFYWADCFGFVSGANRVPKYEWVLVVGAGLSMWGKEW